MLGTRTPETIVVHQGFDERYLREILTRDITPSEAVFDLIDNSIDAARNDLLARGDTSRDEFGLPRSYDGYKVALRITKNIISVSDNSLGIDRHSLEEDTFIIGKPSNHPQGVGYFGVGLKRALLALGGRYLLKTSRPDFAAKMRFSAGDLSIRDEPLTATTIALTHSVRTTILISDLQPGPSHEFSAGSDLSGLLNDLSRRYGLFVGKGLLLTVNGHRVSPFGPSVRQRGPIKPKRWHGKSGEVSMFIEAGMHSRYRATNETGYDADVNKSLTDQYGWYIVCNDRIIEVATKDKKLGFSSAWHPEYNGFVGWAHFVADDPGKLPWDTKKTSIDPNAAVFRSAFIKLEAFSDEFRTENRNIRKAKVKGGPPTKRKRRAKPKKANPEDVADIVDKKHINEWETLFPPLGMGWKDAKLESLLDEAESLRLEFSYSGCALLRMIVERAVDQHIRRSRCLPAVKKSYVDEQLAAGRSFTEEQKANFEPTLGQMLDWLKKNKDYFPEEFRNDCAQAAGKFSSALSKTINGAMHRGNLLGDSQLAIIRNEAYPLIQYLVQVSPHSSA